MQTVSVIKSDHLLHILNPKPCGGEIQTHLQSAAIQDLTILLMEGNLN